MLPKALLSAFFSCLLSSCFCQNYQWWNQRHNWDGITPWASYLEMAPAYMGPNALPVPKFKNGRLRENAFLELAVGSHFGKGDRTQDLFTRLFWPLCEGKVGLDFSVVALEHYSYDSITRDLRKSRDFDGEGWSGGDIYVGTFIQLLQDHGRLPDILLTINLRTASGTNFSAARFTDSPGYFFDLSLGKTYTLPTGPLIEVRPHVSTGFYAWQTNRFDYYQNDAIMYALGCDLKFPKLQVTPSFGGYSGYIGNGDKPMLLRLVLRSRLEQMANYRLMLQHGLRDFPYTSVRVGCELDLSSIL